jgi:hypothetical protein
MESSNSGQIKQNGAKQPRMTLLYENEDDVLVPRFEKKGMWGIALLLTRATPHYILAEIV